MTIIRVRNTPSAVEPPAPPLKDDGSLYRLEMIYGGGWMRAYADTAAEMLEALIAGYPAEMASPRERAAARIHLALRAQVQLQAALAAGSDLEGCSEEQRVLLLSGRDQPPAPATWDAPVLLVLVSTFYRPTGRIDPPQGPESALIWIDPSDDWPLLTSLHVAGVITLNSRPDLLPPAMTGEL